MFTEEVTDRATWRDEWTSMTPIERAFFVTFFVGEYAYLVLVFGGGAVIALGWEPGVHVALAGLTLYWFGHLGTGVTFRVYSALEMVPVALLVIGINLAAFGWGIGVLLMLTGLIARVLAHLVVGAHAYRAIMARPWPQVRPLEDDDDW